MLCPKCQSECWDNRQKKTNPKAPDFKCKNQDCGYAIWPPKLKEEKTIAQSMAKDAPKNNNASLNAMVLSYAKDLTIAEIQATGSVGDLINNVRTYYIELCKIINI